MTNHTLKQNSSNAQLAGAGDSLKNGPRKTYSRLIGALFLAGFLFYGTGFALVSSVIAAPNFLSTLPAHQTTLILGIFLMLLNGPVDIGKAVLFFPILENHSKRTALVYLATMIIEVVLLTAGLLCLLMIVPLAQQGVDVGQAGLGWAKSLGSLLVQTNTMAYQIAEASLAIGCVSLCLLLFQVRLIPQSLALWGGIGYVILMAGSIAEILGIHVGLLPSIPGGLFEVGLGLWLLTVGFEPKAYAQAV